MRRITALVGRLIGRQELLKFSNHQPGRCQEVTWLVFELLIGQHMANIHHDTLMPIMSTNHFIDAPLPFMAATANTAEIRRFSLLEHDVLVTKDSETADDIAVPALVLDTLPGVLCGYHLAQLRGKRGTMYGPYLFQLFQSDSYGHGFATAQKALPVLG